MDGAASIVLKDSWKGLRKLVHWLDTDVWKCATVEELITAETVFAWTLDMHLQDFYGIFGLGVKVAPCWSGGIPNVFEGGFSVSDAGFSTILGILASDKRVSPAAVCGL